MGCAQPLGEARGAAQVEEGVRQAGAVEEVLQRARGRLQQLDRLLGRPVLALVGEDRNGVELLAQLLPRRQARRLEGAKETFVDRRRRHLDRRHFQRAVEAGRQATILRPAKRWRASHASCSPMRRSRTAKPSASSSSGLLQSVAQEFAPCWRVVSTKRSQNSRSGTSPPPARRRRASSASAVFKPGAGGLRRHLALLVLAEDEVGERPGDPGVEVLAGHPGGHRHTPQVARQVAPGHLAGELRIEPRELQRPRRARRGGEVVDERLELGAPRPDREDRVAEGLRRVVAGDDALQAFAQS